MRSFQFWVLLLGSTFVSSLLIKQIFLSRALNQEQRILADSQEMADSATTYENAWKQLALHIFQASRQDPALAQVLKNDNVEIHTGPAGGEGSPPEAAPSLPSVPAKAPVAPPRATSP